MSRDRKLTPGERALWREVTKSITPLWPADEPEPVGEPEKMPESLAPAPKKPADGRPAPKPKTAAPRPKPKQEIEPGRTAGLDRRTQDRLRKGRLIIDATIDLHGHGRIEAMTALHGFLRMSQAAGRRVVLVVTGKGTYGGGVIKNSLHAWLHDPAVRDVVLSYHKARPQHGGDGAFYVLLRRKR